MGDERRGFLGDGDWDVAAMMVGSSSSSTSSEVSSSSNIGVEGCVLKSSIGGEDGRACTTGGEVSVSVLLSVFTATLFRS